MINLPNKLNKIVFQIIFNNLVTNVYYKSKRKQYLTREFLQSEKYDKFMLKFIEYRNQFETINNDAELKTKNYTFRHSKANNKIFGAWRWKGLWKYKKEIIQIITIPDGRGIDFGGANGHVSLHSEIVDFSQKDIFSATIKYHNLDDVDFKADYIFSSHTLEHIENLDLIFKQFKSILKSNGIIILNLPSYTCTRWRSGIHTHQDFNDHKWTFYLDGSNPDHDIKNLLAIDIFAGKYFNVVKKDYAGDDSIILFLQSND